MIIANVERVTELEVLLISTEVLFAKVGWTR
jgi:hypothetical protein